MTKSWNELSPSDKLSAALNSDWLASYDDELQIYGYSMSNPQRLMELKAFPLKTLANPVTTRDMRLALLTGGT